MTLVEFLTARLDEDEANSDCAGSGEYRLCADWSERHVREAAAKRAILARAAKSVTRIKAGVPSPFPEVRFSSGRVYMDVGQLEEDVTEEWERWAAEHQEPADPDLLRILGAVYADHPDYDPAWS